MYMLDYIRMCSILNSLKLNTKKMEKLKTLGEGKNHAGHDWIFLREPSLKQF